MALIITGCMRSGTMTAAKIFGLKHEIQFVPGVTREIINTFYTSNIKMLGEASWLAKPFYQLISETGNSIILLVRNPIAVINSMLGIGFWNIDNKDHKSHRDFILQFDAGLNELSKRGADYFNLCTYYVVYWQRQLLRFPRIRIEDIQTDIQLNKRPHTSYDFREIVDRIPSELGKELKKLCNTLGYTYGI